MKLFLTVLSGFFPAWVAGLAFLISPGCTALLQLATGYNKALESGKKEIPYVPEFIRLFPNSIHFYSYYTGEAGSPTWNSKAGLFGRYVLTMQIPVTFDSTRTTVKSYGAPKFYFVEMTRITPYANGSADIRYRPAAQRNFGEAEWKKFVEANGDWSVLDIKVVKDKPVPHFDEYWKR